MGGPRSTDLAIATEISLCENQNRTGVEIRCDISVQMWINGFQTWLVLCATCLIKSQTDHIWSKVTLWRHLYVIYSNHTYFRY